MSATRRTKGLTFQRSKDGCLTCRRKRKKCDEKLPICTRCEHSRTECIWPPHPTSPGNPSASATVHDRIHQVSAGSVASDQVGPSQRAPESNPDTPPGAASPVTSTHSTDLAVKGWEHAQDYGPRIIWPPNNMEEDDGFDPEGAMPTLLKSIDFLTRTVVIEPVFQEICHYFSTFLSRIFYDYASVPEILMNWMLQRFSMSDSAKYGMLATAVLFRANYERSPLTNALRSHAKELYSLASQQIVLDLKNNALPLQAKLAGLTEITNYEYYSNSLSITYPHVMKSASIVRQIVGSDTIDLLNLGGMHTFEVRCFSWCDILHSMATSRSTLLKYDSDIEQAQRTGSAGGYANPDRGVEWIYGCPDVLAVLLARIIALKHSPVPSEDKLARGAEIEQLVLNWEFRPTGGKGSVMRVARVGVQEIWRHTATLYLHQAIFRSEPMHPTVRNSVRNIVNIASTLRPGVNPDCFLSAPYFIAGSFAISQRDRYTIKFRILSSGNERYLRNLASSLDEIWAENDATGRFTSWSDIEPPTVVF